MYRYPLLLLLLLMLSLIIHMSISKIVHVTFFAISQCFVRFILVEISFSSMLICKIINGINIFSGARFCVIMCISIVLPLSFLTSIHFIRASYLNYSYWPSFFLYRLHSHYGHHLQSWNCEKILQFYLSIHFFYLHCKVFVSFVNFNKFHDWTWKER